VHIFSLKNNESCFKIRTMSLINVASAMTNQLVIVLEWPLNLLFSLPDLLAQGIQSNVIFEQRFDCNIWRKTQRTSNIPFRFSVGERLMSLDAVAEGIRFDPHPTRTKKLTQACDKLT
jgi:hypothetical protein